MARSTPSQYPVHLTAEQRERFEDLCSNGHAPAKAIQHTRLLLLSDHDHQAGPGAAPESPRRRACIPTPSIR